MRPTDRFIFLTSAEWATLNPVIPVNIFAFCTDTRVFKKGDGSTPYLSLPNIGGNTIANKLVQTSRDPVDNEIAVFCGAEDKWIFRLVGCHLTASECISMGTTVYPKFTIIVEIDDDTHVNTGRIKIANGTSMFHELEWIGVPTTAFTEHLIDYENPHQVTKTQVGLPNVTNDSQLKRSADDFAAFDAKTSLSPDDVLLIEDSDDAGNKKKITIATIEELIISYIIALGG